MSGLKMGRLFECSKHMLTPEVTLLHYLCLWLYTRISHINTHSYKAGCKGQLQLCLAITVSELSYASAGRVAYLIWTESQVMEDEH